MLPGVVTGLSGLILGCTPDIAQAAQARSSFGVSVLVVNDCAVTSVPQARGLAVTSRCTVAQPYTLRTAAAGEPVQTGTGEAQGVRYVVISY
jgi:hypothetical protein